MDLMIKVWSVCHVTNVAHCCTGHQYNKQGDLTRWWTNASLEAFNERAQCFVSQYSSYTLQGHQVEWYDYIVLLYYFWCRLMVRELLVRILQIMVDWRLPIGYVSNTGISIVVSMCRLTEITSTAQCHKWHCLRLISLLTSYSFWHFHRSNVYTVACWA